MKSLVSDAKIGTMLGLLQEIVLETDTNHTITFVDPKVKLFTGFTPEEMIGQRIYDFVTEWSCEPLRKALNAAGENKAPKTKILTSNIRKDGSFFPAENCIAPILGGDDKLEAFLILGQSIAQDLDNQSKILQQHLMYQAVVEAQTELICRQSADGTLTFVNNAYCTYYNLNRDELIGTSYYNFIPLEDQRAIRERFRTLTHQNPLITVDHRSFNKDGQMRDHQWMHRALYRPDGSFIEIQSSGRDITDQKSAEARVLMFKAMADVANYGIVIADLDGGLVYANPHFANLYGNQDGNDSNEIDGLSSADHMNHIKSVIEKLLKEESFNALEIMQKTKDGGMHPILMNGVLIRDTRDAPCFAAITAIDLTEKKETEALIREKNQDLALRNTQLNELNNTLKVLLDQRMRDREEMEMSILSNLRELILPLLQDLRNVNMPHEQVSIVNLLENNLLKLLSPYLRHMKSRFPNLTREELQVISLVKDGLATKEISELMGTSQAAVNLHRHNIRRKLGLNKSGQGLVEFLAVDKAL